MFSIYCVFLRLSEQNHKIYLYIYNTVLIRTIRYLTMLYVLAPYYFRFTGSSPIIIRILYGSYTYSMK